MNRMFRHIKRMLQPSKSVLIVWLIAVFCYPVLSSSQKAGINAASVNGTRSSGETQFQPISNAKIRSAIGQPLIGRHSGGGIRGFVGLFYRIPQAPRFESIPPTSALEDNLYSYQIIASDANGDSILYALLQSPDNMQINKFGFLSWTPSESDVGVNGVTLSVYDESGDSSFQVWNINVDNINDPPVITLSDTLAIFREDSSIVIPFGQFLNDPDDLLEGLTLSAIIIDEADDLGDEGIFSDSISNSSLVIDIDNDSKAVTLSGLPDSSGTFTAVFTITDPDESTGNDTTVILILPVNDAPVVSGIPNISFPEDSSFSMDLDDFATDVDNNNSDLNWKVGLADSETQRQAIHNGKKSRKVIIPVDSFKLVKPKK